MTTVMVEVDVPFETTGPVPVIWEVREEALPAVKVTVPPDKFIGEAIARVFTSARVEASEHVDTPEPLLAEQVP
jgi:hypothetical protein